MSFHGPEKHSFWRSHWRYFPSPSVSLKTRAKAIGSKDLKVLALAPRRTLWAWAPLINVVLIQTHVSIIIEVCINIFVNRFLLYFKTLHTGNHNWFISFFWLSMCICNIFLGGLWLWKFCQKYQKLLSMIAYLL